MLKLKEQGTIYVPYTIERITADGDGNFHIYVGGFSYKVNTLDTVKEFEVRDINPMVIIIDNQPVIVSPGPVKQDEKQSQTQAHSNLESEKQKCQ